MARASFLLLRQLLRTQKAPLPSLCGGGSFSGLHSLPNIPNAAPNRSIFLKIQGSSSSSSSNFMKKGFLSRNICAHAHSASEIKEKKDQLKRDFESSKRTADKLKIFQEMEALSDDEEYIADGCYSMGLALLNVDNAPAKALPFVKRAVEFYDKGDTELSLKLAECLNLFGEVYDELNLLNDALVCLYRALGVLDSIKDDDSGSVWFTLNRTHYLLSFTMRKIGRAEEAADHLRMSLDIGETKLAEKPHVLGFGYMDAAELYASMSKYKEALPCCLKALYLHMNEHVLAIVRRLLGKIYTGLEEHEKAHEQKKLSQGVLGQSSSYSLDSVIDAAKMLIAFGRCPDAMDVLEKSLVGAYIVSQHVDFIIPVLQKKIDEARKLWRSCEEKGFYRGPVHHGNQAIDLGKEP